MDIPNFLNPRLDGRRFANHEIPLELLGDLAVLESMIIEVAKWQYRKENPGRKRSPRGFTDGVLLSLKGISEGSAIAVMSLSLGTDGRFPALKRLYFDQARDAIVSAIGAAAEGKSPIAHLPREGLAYFDRLGRSLLDGEAIVFPNDVTGTPARLTKETRLRLLRAAEVTERSEEVRLRGMIHAVDQYGLSFEIMLPDGSRIPGPVGEPHLETIIEAHYGYRKGVKVLIEGVGRYNRSERLQRIESVEHVTLLDPLDVPSRLGELRTLQDGWLDGRGVAPGLPGLEWFARAFDGHYPDDLPLPYIYPVAEGGIQLEWPLPPRELSLEINFGDHSAEWHLLDLDTDDEDSRSLNLDEPGDWDWLAGRLKALAGAEG